ncbi:DNA/RNA nuclease SfsA [Methanosphaera sp.]
MKIDNLIEVTYISRPNRFTVEFKDNDNKIDIAHLHDPGRLKELLIPGVSILIKFIPTYEKTGRKTKYDVIAIENRNNWILLNSSYHNKLVDELITNKEIPGLEEYYVFKPEYSYGNSRLDFLLKNKNEDNLYLEVKGCTLVKNNLAKFPDAPTTRGTKHLKELITIKNDNKNSAVIILILHNNAEKFSPNYDTDPEFSLTLKEAYDTGVTIIPFHINILKEENSLKLIADTILPILFR